MKPFSLNPLTSLFVSALLLPFFAQAATDTKLPSFCPAALTMVKDVESVRTLPDKLKTGNDSLESLKVAQEDVRQDRFRLYDLQNTVPAEHAPANISTRADKLMKIDIKDRLAHPEKYGVDRLMVGSSAGDELVEKTLLNTMVGFSDMRFWVKIPPENKAEFDKIYRQLKEANNFYGLGKEGLEGYKGKAMDLFDATQSDMDSLLQKMKYWSTSLQEHPMSDELAAQIANQKAALARSEAALAAAKQNAQQAVLSAQSQWNTAVKAAQDAQHDRMARYVQQAAGLGIVGGSTWAAYYFNGKKDK